MFLIKSILYLFKIFSYRFVCFFICIDDLLRKIFNYSVFILPVVFLLHSVLYVFYFESLLKEGFLIFLLSIFPYFLMRYGQINDMGIKTKVQKWLFVLPYMVGGLLFFGKMWCMCMQFFKLP